MIKLIICNFKMMFRNRQTLFWSLAFPVIFIVVFGVFKMDQVPPAKFAIIDQAKNLSSESVIKALDEIELLNIEDHTDVNDAKKQLQEGFVDFVLVIPDKFIFPAQKTQTLNLYTNPTNIQVNQLVLGTLQSFADQTALQINQTQPVLKIKDTPVNSRDIKYIDFLMPGIIGQAVMFSALMGTAIGISRYREQKVLKRLLATPLKVRDFLIGEVISRLALALVQTSLIMLTAFIFFDVQVFGNVLWVFGLALIGNLVFIQLGFFIAGVTKTASAAEGLSNFITMPLMILSGVFFDTETLPNFLEKTVNILPLAPLIEVLRGVSLYANQPWMYITELGILVVWALASFLLAWHTFKFEQESR